MSQEPERLAQPPALPCTRCQVNHRIPGQRWCRQCLTASQKQRRAARRAEPEAAPPIPVTHAATQRLPGVTHPPQALQEPSPGSTGTPPLTPLADPQALQALADQVQALMVSLRAKALTAYRNAQDAYARAEQQYGKWQRLRVVEAESRLKAARQLCLRLGLNPDEAKE